MCVLLSRVCRSEFENVIPNAVVNRNALDEIFSTGFDFEFTWVINRSLSLGGLRAFHIGGHAVGHFVGKVMPPQLGWIKNHKYLASAGTAPFLNLIYPVGGFTGRQ